MSNGVVDLAIEPRSAPTTGRQGLRKLSPDLISEARDKTAAQVIRIGLTFLGTTAFCVVSLLTPDSAMLGGNDRINVPVAGPVPFIGFMMLGPALLIALRLYLQIYVEHSDRLDRLARRMRAVRAPTLLPLRNPLIRIIGGLTFYLLLPLVIMLFAWKAAVFPFWGSGLLCVATTVIVSHGVLPLSKISRRSKIILSTGAAIVTAVTVLASPWPLGRPFNLERANLSGQLLTGQDLRDAHLSHADLGGASLVLANLSGADLSFSNLSGTHLGFAELLGANLNGANLRGSNLGFASLGGANLQRTNLGGADLTDADLRRANMSGANLINANLQRAKLAGANLSGANLVNAKLNRANLSYSIPSFKLQPSNQRQFLPGFVNLPANLSGANLTGADLSDAELGNANLQRANLGGANISGADLSGADLSGAALSLVDLSGVDLRNAKWVEACANGIKGLPEGITLKACPSRIGH
jgi:uncharacterized protein YjbI with pentapeptide repeats